MIRIAQDMDGVIFDLMTEFARIYNDLNSTSKTVNDVTRWSFYEDWGMTKEECFEIFDEIDQRNCKLLDPDIPKYLKRLNENFDVDIVTLKPIKNKPIIKEALEMNGIIEGIHYNKLVVLSYEVSHVKLSLDYDIYIDDSEGLANEFNKTEDDKTLLLYDSPWNQSIKEEGKILRVKGWDDIMELVNNTIIGMC